MMQNLWFHGINAIFFKPQIFDVSANETAKYKCNNLELFTTEENIIIAYIDSSGVLERAHCIAHGWFDQKFEREISENLVSATYLFYLLQSLQHESVMSYRRLQKLWHKTEADVQGNFHFEGQTLGIK